MSAKASLVKKSATVLDSMKSFQVNRLTKKSNFCLLQKSLEKTRIKFLTDGMLLREAQRDPSLKEEFDFMFSRFTRVFTFLAIWQFWPIENYDKGPGRENAIAKRPPSILT